ncbi:MAG: YitT family protein [Erysipelotrichia bacterium]|nr:YitT family protein [Erysipelotrichia bacterium]
MMSKKRRQRWKKQIENFMFDHYRLKAVLDYLLGFLVATVSAVIFAFGFSCFVTPSVPGDFVLATGGIAGFTQIIALTLELITGKVFIDNTIQSIAYTALNVPLLVFSFMKIGKRFSFFTMVNVILTSIFISFFSQSGIAKEVADFNFSTNLSTASLSTPIVRVLFAGITTGLASALAYTAGISCGGIDIITYYVGAKKSTQVGRYGVIINVSLVITYSLLKLADGQTSIIYSLFSIIFSVIYIMEAGLIIDAINLRNKKIEIQIITEKEHMAEVMIAYFPHSATISEGKGAYSKAKKYIMWMVVSSSEVKHVVSVAKKVDEHVFIAVTPLKQVYGNFFIKPVR